MKKLALIAALSVVGIANAQAADGTITINTPISTLNKLFKLNRRITTFFIHNDADRM